jgi:hypothetical protein
MKHLKAFINEDQGLLGDMQGLGLAPKPLGFYISLCSYGDSDVNALGVVVIGPSFASIAEMLYEEFNMGDIYDDYNEMNLKSIFEVMDKFIDDSYEIDIQTIYNVWEMTPRTNDISQEIVDTCTLMTPHQAVELGKKYFRDFDEEMRGNPNGLKQN